MRRWKVGTLTMGLVLIGLGALLIIGRIQGTSSVDLIYKWWPIILVFLGIETLIFSQLANRSETRIRYDGISIFLIIVMIVFILGGHGLKFIFDNLNFSPRMHSIIRDYKYETKLYKEIDVSADGVKRLLVSNSLGKIDVSRGSEDDIKIEANITMQNNDEAYAKSLEDSAVKISKGSEIRVSTTNYNDSRIKNVYIDYVIKVPEGIEVDVDNSFGDIIVREIASNVNIENSNGRITAGNIGGDLKVKNSFGAIEINDTGGNVTASGSNGGIFIKNTKGNIEVNNSFGSIDVQIAGGDVKARGDNGRIFIEAPAGDVSAHNSFGEVYVINPGKSVELKSSNGLIRLQAADIIKGNVTIKNSFGGIKLDIPKNQAGKMKLSTSFGSINSNINLNIVKDVSKASVDQILGDGSILLDLETSNGNIDVKGN